MGVIQKITPHLWFDTEAEQAARFYTSIFQDSTIEEVTYYKDEGKEIHGKGAGEVMTVEFTLEDQTFLALNGGPHFTFNPSISFLIHCTDQEEVDYYWNHLSEGGNEKAQQCGWLQDKYGVSWQVIPERLPELLNHPSKAVAERVTKEMLQMKKIDIRALEVVRNQTEKES